MKIDNPYLKEFLSFQGDEYNPSSFVKSFMAREGLVKKYAWAIPDKGAIEIIKKYGPIVEIGAGTGYWSYLMRQVGIDVVSYDQKPYNNHFCEGQWAEVKKGSGSKASLHSDRTLLLCWPPMSNMASQSLNAYQGNTVIYIGESHGGCTADDKFFEEIHKNWKDVEEYGVPQWPGLHDWLNVYKRNK